MGPTNVALVKLYQADLKLREAQGRIVYDLVYNPPETMLMRWAREAGAEVIGGMEMLIEQAYAQQRWWAEEPRGARNAG